MPLRIFCEPPTLFLLMQSLTAIPQLDVFHKRRFGCETSQSAGQRLLGNREEGGARCVLHWNTSRDSPRGIWGANFSAGVS